MGVQQSKPEIDNNDNELKELDDELLPIDTDSEEDNQEDEEDEDQNEDQYEGDNEGANEDQDEDEEIISDSFDSNSLFDRVDSIATNYILTMDFKSLKKLNEKQYCDKLVLMTSDIFKKKMTSKEVKYLLNRTQYGSDVNPDYLNQMKKEKFYFYMNEHNKFDKQDVTLNDNEMEETEKVRVCMGIAKFYIIIAHLFASIVKTINPVYSYVDSDGNDIEVDFFNKDRIPPNVKTKVKRISLCDNRLKALKENIQIDNNNEIYFETNNCNIDVEEETLNNEPGIYEFQNLYMDDNYDYLTGNFTSRSDTAQKLFNTDLKSFYTHFTGIEEVPDSIKTFSDIKLSQFNKGTPCEGNDEKIYETTGNSKAFQEYATNLREMMQSTTESQQELLKILNLIFIEIEEEQSDEVRFKLSPELNDDNLLELVKIARKHIMNLYQNCEKNYLNGIQIYKTIVGNETDKLKERQKKLSKVLLKYME